MPASNSGGSLGTPGELKIKFEIFQAVGHVSSFCCGTENFDSSQPFMRQSMMWLVGGLPTVRKDPLSKELLRLKKKTSWSWERMCREMHRVMGEEGPTHTTLFRYASGRVRRRNVLTERYVQQAIHRLAAELSQK